MLIREATSQDKNKWNEVVTKSANGTFYHTWEWNKVIDIGLNVKPILIVAEEENKLVGIFCFHLINGFAGTKFDENFKFISDNFKILWSPHPRLYSFGGPCVPSEEKIIYNRIFSYIDDYVKKERSIFDSWIYPSNNNLDSVLVENGYIKRRDRKTVIIDLEKNIEDICKTFKKQYRRDIKHSVKSGVVISESDGNINDINLYYNKFQKALIDRIVEKTNNNYEIVSNADVPYAYFKAINEILFPKRLARLFFAEYNGEKIAALMNFYYKDTMYIGNISGVRGEYGALNANRLLIWRAIVDGKEKGFRKFDLSGLTPDTASGEYFFKIGFNGEILETGQYKKMYRYKILREHYKGIYRN